MLLSISSPRTRIFRKVVSLCITFTFIFSLVVPPQARAQMMIPANSINLPPLGTMITPTEGFQPAIIKGMTVHPDNPLQFTFIVDQGQEVLEESQLKEASTKMIKYFLASLTVPEDEMWVNLSPYEKERIVPEGLGVTELGKDLLSQDYLLKQLTASLIYPEKDLGQKFWEKVYAKAHTLYGTTDIPIDTFNKVWIVPESAKIYVHENSSFVVNKHLKVMLEEDYLASEGNAKSEIRKLKERESLNAQNLKEKTWEHSALASKIIREIIIPAIEQEVNNGRTFSTLRQIYNSMILATWYKQNLQETLLNQVYANQNKTMGVDVKDKDVKHKIYNQYLEAFKEGVYNYIKEDYDPTTQEIVPHKYFSGGLVGVKNYAMITHEDQLGMDEKRVISKEEGVFEVDSAMIETRHGYTFAQGTDAEKLAKVILGTPEKQEDKNAAMLSFVDGSNFGMANDLYEEAFENLEWLKRNLQNERIQALLEEDESLETLIKEYMVLYNPQREELFFGDGTISFRLRALSSKQKFKFELVQVHQDHFRKIVQQVQARSSKKKNVKTSRPSGLSAFLQKMEKLEAESPAGSDVRLVSEDVDDFLAERDFSMSTQREKGFVQTAGEIYKDDNAMLVFVDASNRHIAEDFIKRMYASKIQKFEKETMDQYAQRMKELKASLGVQTDEELYAELDKGKDYYLGQIKEGETIISTDGKKLYIKNDYWRVFHDNFEEEGLTLFSGEVVTPQIIKKIKERITRGTGTDQKEKNVSPWDEREFKEQIKFYDIHTLFKRLKIAQKETLSSQDFILTPQGLMIITANAFQGMLLGIWHAKGGNGKAPTLSLAREILKFKEQEGTLGFVKDLEKKRAYWFLKPNGQTQKAHRPLDNDTSYETIIQKDNGGLVEHIQKIIGTKSVLIVTKRGGVTEEVRRAFLHSHVSLILDNMTEETPVLVKNHFDEIIIYMVSERFFSGEGRSGPTPFVFKITRDYDKDFGFNRRGGMPSKEVYSISSVPIETYFEMVKVARDGETDSAMVHSPAPEKALTKQWAIYVLKHREGYKRSEVMEALQFIGPFAGKDKSVQALLGSLKDIDREMDFVRQQYFKKDRAMLSDAVINAIKREIGLIKSTALNSEQINLKRIYNTILLAYTIRDKDVLKSQIRELLLKDQDGMFKENDSGVIFVKPESKAVVQERKKVFNAILKRFESGDKIYLRTFMDRRELTKLKGWRPQHVQDFLGEKVKEGVLEYVSVPIGKGRYYWKKIQRDSSMLGREKSFTMKITDKEKIQIRAVQLGFQNVPLTREAYLTTVSGILELTGIKRHLPSGKLYLQYSGNADNPLGGEVLFVDKEGKEENFTNFSGLVRTLHFETYPQGEAFLQALSDAAMLSVDDINMVINDFVGARIKKVSTREFFQTLADEIGAEVGAIEKPAKEFLNAIAKNARAPIDFSADEETILFKDAAMLSRMKIKDRSKVKELLERVKKEQNVTYFYEEGQFPIDNEDVYNEFRKVKDSLSDFMSIRSTFVSADFDSIVLTLSTDKLSDLGKDLYFEIRGLTQEPHKVQVRHVVDAEYAEIIEDILAKEKSVSNDHVMNIKILNDQLNVYGQKALQILQKEYKNKPYLGYLKIIIENSKIILESIGQINVMGPEALQLAIKDIKDKLTVEGKALLKGFMDAQQIDDFQALAYVANAGLTKEAYDQFIKTNSPGNNIPVGFVMPFAKRSFQADEHLIKVDTAMVVKEKIMVTEDKSIEIYLRTLPRNMVGISFTNNHNLDNRYIKLRVPKNIILEDISTIIDAWYKEKQKKRKGAFIKMIWNNQQFKNRLRERIRKFSEEKNRADEAKQTLADAPSENSDHAMRGLDDQELSVNERRKGGIDLNASHLNLQILRDENWVPLPVEMQPMESFHIDGFIPVILNIAPISNLPLLLGFDYPADSDEDGHRQADANDGIDLQMGELKAKFELEKAS